MSTAENIFLCLVLALLFWRPILIALVFLVVWSCGNNPPLPRRRRR